MGWRGTGIAKAKTHGVAVVGVRNSHHLARIGKWAEMAAEQGLISIHFTNVAGHDPLVAPFLGTDARLGTNPFTIGFPGFPNGQPVILDYATSVRADSGGAHPQQSVTQPLTDVRRSTCCCPAPRRSWRCGKCAST
jgi:LDH2 family malate/lactate/ureidoglycolate dehydrogenase